MKKIISLLLSLAMLLTITSGLNLTAYAAVRTGSCGDNVTYSLDTSTGVLTISGTGDMKNYSSYSPESPFYCTSEIKSVIIDNGITSIGDYAFEKCRSLTSITIPNSVTSIGIFAFYYCTSLTSVTIPKSVTSIGDNAFCYCTSLTNITIPNSVTSISSDTFWNCTSLKSVTIPNSVTSIGSSAFRCCTSLANITIPDSVISIFDNVFISCDSLTSIEVSDNNKNYSSVDGVLFNKDKSKLITYPDGKTDNTYEIPNSVTSIGVYAFSYCTSLTSITIPNSVTNIGVNSFEECTSLTSVTIPDSVTSIGGWAFDGCRSLTSLTIPKSVTSIDRNVFYNSTSLKDVYYTGSRSDWKKISIGPYNQYLTNATIHYNWTGEFPLVTNEDETSFTVYNSTAIIDGANDVNLKLKSVNMNIAENSSQFDKKKVVKKNDIKGKEIKFTKDDFRDYIIPAKVTSDSKYLKSNSHNIYMTKDRKDGKPYVSSVYVQQLDKKNKPKKAYVDAQYDGATLIDGVNYNLVISAVTNGAKDVKYYLIQNDGNSKYKTEITNGVASKIDLASKMEEGKSLYAYVVCDGVASEPVSLKLEKKKLSNSLKNLMSSSTVNVLGGQSGKFKLSDSVPIIGGTEASLDFMKIPAGVEITGNKVKISIGLDLFGNTETTGNNGKTKSDWIKFKDNCKSFQETSKDHNDTLKKLKKFKKNYGSNKKRTFKTDFLGYLEGYITDTGSIEFTDV